MYGHALILNSLSVFFTEVEETFMSSAAILVIGDEILHGEIRDQNGPWLINQLSDRGVRVKRCNILPDDPTVIASEINRFSDCDFILTTGGVGPTHDDRTLESVALALNRDLESDEELLAMLQREHGSLKENQKKMAVLPEGSEFFYLKDSVGLAFKIRNVYVFPGFPELLKPLFFRVEDHFTGKPLTTKTIKTKGYESELAGMLEDFQERYPSLQFGSYPHPDGTITLKIRGTNPQDVKKAEQSLQKELSESGY